MALQTRRRYGSAPRAQVLDDSTSAQVNPDMSQRQYASGGGIYNDGGNYPNFSGSPNIGTYQFNRYNPNYDAGGPQTFNPDYTTEDPARMAVQDRTVAADRGNRIDSDYANEIANRYQMENRYRQPMDAAYSRLANNPGYTDDERNAIMREGSMPGTLTNDQINGMYLTENEQGGIKGDPGSQYAWYNPAQTQGIAENAAGGANGAMDDWSNAGRGAWSGMSVNTRGAISRANLGPSQDYMDQQDAGINGGEGNVRGALGKYGGQVDSSLSGGGSRVRSYTGDPSLKLSSEYNQRMNFSPEDEQNMVTAAGTSVGNSTRAARDRVEREAAASGNNSALALNAGLQDLQRQGDVNAEDAMLNARIGAKKLGLDTAQQKESTRLGAEQNRANLGANSELALQRNELGAYSDLAGQTAANEQQLANRRLGAAGEREGYRSNAEKTRMGADLQNEQYLGQSQMDQEAQLGKSRIDNAYRSGQIQQDANLANQNMGVNIARNVDQSNSDRSAQIADNRQGVAKYGQATQYSQGLQNNQALSNRAAGVADARRQGEQEYRGFLIGQTNSQQQAGQAARSGRVQGYGTQMSAQNQATGNASDYKTRNPSFGRALGQSVANNLGKWAGPFGGGN